MQAAPHQLKGLTVLCPSSWRQTGAHLQQALQPGQFQVMPGMQRECWACMRAFTGQHCAQRTACPVDVAGTAMVDVHHSRSSGKWGVL